MLPVCLAFKKKKKKSLIFMTQSTDVPANEYQTSEMFT